MDKIILFINAVIWLVILINALSKYKLRNLGTKYILFYAVLNFLALHLFFYLPEAQALYGGQHLFFLLYLIFFIFMFIKPLLNFDTSVEKHLVHPPSTIMNPIYIFVIVFSLLGIIDSISNFSSSFFMLATEEDYGARLYQDLQNTAGLSGRAKDNVINYISVISNFARGLAPFLLLYYLSYPNRNRLIAIGLLLSTLISFMNSISIGSRLAIVSLASNIFFMFLYMKQFYSTKMLRIISPVLLGVSVIIGTAFFYLTVSRTLWNKENPIMFVERYAAASFLNFGKYGLNPGGSRYGDRTFPLIKSIFTDDVARSYYERITKYTELKINESAFITFVGDFTIDFGPILGAAVMLVLIFLFTKNLKNSSVVRFEHLSLLYLLIMILNGFYQYPLADYGGNIYFLSYLFLFIFFNFFVKGDAVSKP